MDLNETLAHLYHRKRRWSPTVPTPGEVVKGAETTLQRALSLRILELPVGEFVTAASKRDLPVDETGRRLLEWNIQDETVHDRALQALVDVMGYPQSLPQAEEFKKEILSIYEQGEYPLQLARVLESSVFFIILPLLRFLGNMAMKTVSADISGDETVHASAHTLISKAVGSEPSKRLRNLRREIVAWMVEDLNGDVDLPEHHKQFGNRDFWIKQSDQLLYQGRASGLTATRRTNVMAFFEINKLNQPSYS